MLNNHTDASNIQAYRAGNNLAFDQLYRRYERPLFSFILRTVRDRSMADDLFQQTWLKAIKGLPKYNEQGKFSSWLFGIAHNCCIDQIRKKQNKIEANTIKSDVDPFIQIKGDLPDPEAVMIRNEETQLIKHTLDRIPEEQRQVLLLRLNGEMPFKEIAELMQCSINTVLGRMHYAIKNVRKIIQESTGEGTQHVLS